MKDYQLKYLKKNLINKIENQKKSLSAHKDLTIKNIIDDTSELSTYDNHPAELGSETYELSKELSMGRHQSKQISELVDALDRIENGKYGTCEFCGNEVAFERLEIIPEAKLCVKCEREKKVEAEDLEYDNPAKEIYLETPSLSTSKRGANNSYDAEDAWQEVQIYGSSSGPQDISTNDTKDYDDTWYNNHETRGGVEDVENISNEEYKKQLPDSHGNSYEGYVDTKEQKVDYFGDDENK